MKNLKTYKKFIIFAIVLTMLFSPVLCIKAHTIIDITNIKVIDIDGKSAKIEWSTNVATNGKVIFGDTKDELSAFIIDGKGSSKYHYVVLGNLKSDTEYYYKIIVNNNSGQVESYLKDFKTSDFDKNKKPRINDVKIDYVSGTAAVVTWTTDKEASSRVEYDDNETYKKKAGSNKKVTSHLVIIKNLEPSINYKLRLYSVDKNKNNSGFIYKTFTTKSNDIQDKEDLIISRLRPSGNNDSDISNNTIKVSFKTNHYAEGSISLRADETKTQNKDIEYGTNHEIYFHGLIPDVEYDISIEMKDIFGKKEETEILGIKTSETNRENITCDTDTTEIFGYYGQYFNLDASHPTIGDERNNIDRDWFNEKYLSFTKVDYDLDFGNGFFPVDEDLPNDPYYFSVYWKANIEMSSDDDFKYKVLSDDDSWVYVDGKLKTDLGGLHKVKGKTESIKLTKGSHFLEIYFVERGPWSSHFSFVPDGNYKINPIIDCSSVSIQEPVIVKGAEFSMYTPASALYKMTDTPNIYAIVNNQRHYISLPSSFEEYGYRWADIKTVSKQELYKYPRARLIKSAENNKIYFLYQRFESQWLKIAMPSPTVFVSYPNNYWGNVITVTQLDVDAYPDVKLIKTKNDPAVYYLENGTKQYVSATIFEAKGFSYSEIAEVNQVHIDSYKTGEALN